MAPVRERVGPYRLLEEIGVGGMGEVHLALDPRGRTVAVKILHPAVARDESSRLRLEREVATMRRVCGPHVAEVLDADFHAARPYIVTRYVPGLPLDVVVREHGVLRGAALVRLARGLAEALRSMHDAGIVHRDLKPGNVMMVDGQPVVIDFGLAHVLDATRLTRTGTAIGTPGYLAPEILDGSRAEPAADVFSWGATVTFAATGSSPYGSGPAQAIFSRILRAKFDVSDLPEPPRTLVAKALAPTSAKRPSAGSLLTALEEERTAVVRPRRRGEMPGLRPGRPGPEVSTDRAARAGASRSDRSLTAGRRLVPPAVLLAPAVCYAMPVLAAGLVLAVCCAVYGRQAVVRAAGHLRALRGGLVARAAGAVMVLVAIPLQVVLRLCVLMAVAGAGFGVLLAVTLPLVGGARGWALPAGLLVPAAEAVRAWFHRGRPPLRRFARPALMAVVLALAVAGVPVPAWWPLPA